jgi:hypothetical protein
MLPRRRPHPWPLGIALALLAMIGACLALWVIAASHADPLVTVHPRPGLER